MATLEPWDHAFKGGRIVPGPPEPIPVANIDLLGARSEEEELSVLRFELRPRGVGLKPSDFGDATEERIKIGTSRTRPRRDRPLFKGQIGISNHQLGINLVASTEARTVRARPIGRVEREGTGNGLLKGSLAVRACQMLRETQGLPHILSLGIDDLHLGHSPGEAKGLLHRLSEALTHPFLEYESVHHHLDGVLLIASQRHVGPVAQFHHGPVDAGTSKTLGRQVVEQRRVLAFAPPDHRSQHEKPASLLHGQHPVNDLLGSLAGHGTPAGRTMRAPGSSEEQSQVVVDLGDGAHR